MIKYSFLFIVLCCYSAQAQISSDGLLAYYNFENNSEDQSGNAFNGTLISGDFITEGTNTSLLLNGVDDYLDLSIFADTLRENLNEMSIFFRIKFIEKDDNQTILSLGNSGESISTNVFEVEYENNQFQVETETEALAINNEYGIDQATNILTDEWIDVLLLLKDDTLTYCRNGIEVYSDLYKPSETTSRTFFVGCFGGDNIDRCCFFGGQIDDLQFYNRILTKKDCENDIEGQLGFELCENETLTVNDVEYSADGIYIQNLLTSDNCDSLLYITVVTKARSNYTEFYNGCMNDGYEVLVDGIVFDEKNPNGVIVLTGSNDCDSIVNIDLNFNNCFDCNQPSPNLGMQVIKISDFNYQLVYGNNDFSFKSIDNLESVIEEIYKIIIATNERRPSSRQLPIDKKHLQRLIESMKINSSIKL